MSEDLKWGISVSRKSPRIRTRLLVSSRSFDEPECQSGLRAGGGKGGVKVDCPGQDGDRSRASRGEVKRGVEEADFRVWLPSAFKYVVQAEAEAVSSGCS